MTTIEKITHRTRDGFICHADGIVENGLITTAVNHQYEIGGTWIHWSQPHVWSEMTHYGFSLIESEGAVADQINILLDNGSKLKSVSTTDLYPKLFEFMNKFSDVDGVQGRTIFPLPHAPLTVPETVQAYDPLAMQDRLDQILP